LPGQQPTVGNPSTEKYNYCVPAFLVSVADTSSEEVEGRLATTSAR